MTSSRLKRVADYVKNEEAFLVGIYSGLGEVMLSFAVEKIEAFFSVKF